MLSELREEVWRANLALAENNLVAGTSGNASGIDRRQGQVVIKPSGVPYARLKAKDLVIVDLEGKRVEGKLNPSVDTCHHLYLYRAREEIGGVVHTHSPYATMFAMLERPIPVLSTAHADIFGRGIPCTPYVDNLGDSIGEIILEKMLPGCPAILLGKHGPFTFAEDVKRAVTAAVMLEYVAHTSHGALTLAASLDVKLTAFPPEEAEKWYRRHHGGIAGVTYGQEEEKFDERR